MALYDLISGNDESRHSNTQFWTFGRGRLDVKAFLKSQGRKQYLYNI